MSAMLATELSIEDRAQSTTHVPVVLLESISWQTYQNLLQDLSATPGIRLTYLQGYLEISMAPLSLLHSESTTLLHDFIKILAEELDLNIHSLDAITLHREDLQSGLEPDKAYYIQHASVLKTITNRHQYLDLTQLPPPDLVVEVDVTSHSLNKLSTYLALGIPEVWRYDGKNLYIYQLSDEKYLTCTTSPTFAHLPVINIIPQLMAQSYAQGQIAVLREFRHWVKKPT
jgi:Uma2 family endonuclease